MTYLVTNLNTNINCLKHTQRCLMDITYIRLFKLSYNFVTALLQFYYIHTIEINMEYYTHISKSFKQSV